MKKTTIKRGLLPYIFIFVFLLCIFMFSYSSMSSNIHEITYGKFVSYAEKNKVEKITITPRSRASIYNITGTLENYKQGESFTFNMPLTDETMVKLLALEDEKGFKMTTTTDPESSTLLLFIINVLPMVLLIGFAFYFITRQMAGGSRSMDFGKSRAKLTGGETKVTFKDVAGLTEEKEEVSELIDFLKSPKKFQKMGARIPKGVLLYGPPGTGKTLLAKAVAGEANVPFYFISGSEFVELFVGVGASRVRDMFKQAKQNAPCLIFIDEIDAVGRQRGAGLGGGHDEREQTLNQLLTEMDGFGANEGIIIIAATNRPDVLDPALLRPGRFDRQITVNLPDAKGREEILGVHANGKIFEEGITMKNIAKRTVGFSGADLENLLNEAALLAVRRNKDAITMEEVDEAQDRVLMGPAKVTRKMSEKENKLTAYHEAGHAVLGIKLDGASDVHKITIIPRGKALGYNMMLPKEDKVSMTKGELLEQISGLLAGRVAEEIMFDEVTTGASNDFEQATKIARAMVTEYGMSDLGPIQFERPESSNVFLGRDYNKQQNFSTAVANEVDEEVRKIIMARYKVAKKVIEENMDLLHLIAKTLLKYETITKEQIDYLVEHGHMKEDEEEIILTDLSEDELKEIAKDQNIENYEDMTKDELIESLNKNKENDQE